MKKLMLFCLLLFSSSLIAQQLPLFSQYQDNYIAINPAMVNRDFLLNEDNLSFGVSHRNQWAGLKNAPKTQLLRGEYIAEARNFSWLTGGYLINDETGPVGLTGLYGRIGAIMVGDAYYGGLALALNLGVVQYRIDTRALNLRDDNDIVAMDQQMQIFPDVGFGIYYYKLLDHGFLKDDYVYAGISIPQTISINTKFQDVTGGFSLQRVQHFYAQAGIFKFLEEESYLEFASWAKFVEGAKMNVNVNVRYQTNAAIWVGIGGTTAGSSHVETGILLGNRMGFNSNVRIGYGFDYNFRSFGPSAGGTHEISVSCSFQKF